MEVLDKVCFYIIMLEFIGLKRHIARMEKFRNELKKL